MLRIIDPDRLMPISHRHIISITQTKNLLVSKRTWSCLLSGNGISTLKMQCPADNMVRDAQVIHIQPSRCDRVPLSKDETTKYLGIYLQSNLAWRQLINRVMRKAKNMLRFLRSNLPKASAQTNTSAYTTMVRSNLQYCCTICSPHHQDQKQQKK